MLGAETRLVPLRSAVIAAFIFSCCLLVACRTPVRTNGPIVIGGPPTDADLEAAGLSKSVQVLSFPVGGIVELNNEYIGTTPLTLTVRTGGGGTWTDSGSRAGRFVLKCSSANGQIWEEKVWLVGERVPDKILFRIGGDAPLLVR